MPLLNKKPLQLHRYNKKLNDDAEVFYCKCTNEIFEDYEEYCERVISCNSLIWTCAITGKSNLTYQEALMSEQNALKSVKDFPHELRTPVLYLATKTNRGSFNDFAGDVFNFVKDRYFLGESVEVNFDGIWCYGHVLQVLLPSKDEVEAYKKANNITGPVSHRPYPSPLYKYEVEQLDDEAEVSEVRVVSADKIRRIKGVYTREKNRVYLRQFAQLKKGKWQIQSNILAKYSVLSISFSRMFVGEPPIFEDTSLSESKYTQPTIDSFFAKNSDKKKVKSEDSVTADLINIRKKYEDTIDIVVEKSRLDLIKGKDTTKKMDSAQVKKLEDKAKRLEELRRKREQEREEKARWASFVKEWHRKREDLECEDLKKLPEPRPVDCRLPNEYFGDAVMILEFFFGFRGVLKVKNYFPYGLRFDVLERALVDVEVAGPFSEILQLLLSSLFVLQEQEDYEIRSTSHNHSKDLEINECGDVSTAEAIRQATIANSWSQVYHGVPLNQLFLDSISVSEILRLHLLASGGRAGERNAKWRYQERGGYTNTDDPCLMLRLKEPHILRFLAVKSVVELPVGDKIKVLSCLINQILTYAHLRDLIEERYEKVKTSKIELKNDRFAETRKEKEKIREKKEAKDKGEEIPEETEEQKLEEEKESNRKKAEFQRRTTKLQKEAMGCHVAPLGQDRSYRRFWIFNSLGGLFVEDNEQFPGSCLPEPTPTARNLANIEEDTMSYIRKLFAEERNCGSDKENEGNLSHPMASPKKKLLSESNDLTTFNPILSSMKVEEGEEKPPEFVCTANKETCPVHSWKKKRTQWLFYHKESEIEELINCLNKRGYREHRLRKNLIEFKDNIIPKLGQCPVQLLDRIPTETTDSAGTTKNLRSQKGYENANLKYPPGTPVQDILEFYIRDLILDMEEKIYHGALGTIKVEDRTAWRQAIHCRSYNRQDDNLTWRQYPVKKEQKKTKKEESTSRPDTPCSMDSNSEQDVVSPKMEQNHVLKDLASAVLQLGRSVEPKYLQKPLYDENKREKMSTMERWESSLMSSTSLSQVYLHLTTLENSIQWSRSALNAKCKTCRRGGDGVNMLLCDNCNRGYHLYCLKPKLTSIPEGDWFCVQCRPAEVVKENKRSRKLFTEESDDDLPLASTRIRRTKPEEPSRRRRARRAEEDEEDEDSGDEPLAKMVKLSRRSAQRKDLD